MYSDGMTTTRELIQMAAVPGTSITIELWSEGGRFIAMRLDDGFVDDAQSYDTEQGARDQANEWWTAARPAPQSPEVTEGYYTVNDSIFRVKLSGSGHLYALRVTASGSEYAPGMMPEIRKSGERLTKERAAEFGHRVGRCVMCGRDLTNPESVERGYGPVCAERMGW